MELINSNNLVIVIVTYNPDEGLFALLSVLKGSSFKIVIVDNGSENQELIIKKIHTLFPSIIIIDSEKNRGIAWGLNIGIKEALKFAPKWILTFDQDTIPADDFVYLYNYIIKNESNIGLIASNFTTEISQITRDRVIEYSKSLTLITSGTLHNVEVFGDIGMYNEILFIDYVDFDFVLRVAEKYPTFVIKNKLLCHHIGNPIIKKIFGRPFLSSNHSPLRRYYKARNYVFVLKKYIAIYPFWIISKGIAFIYSILIMILVENDRLTKLKKLVKGFYDGILLK